MAFKVVADTTFPYRVKVKLAGDLGEASFVGVFKHFPKDEQAGLAKRMADATNQPDVTPAKMIMEVLVGWKEVNDEDDKPLEFTEAALAKMINQHADALNAIGRAFNEGLHGFTRGN